MMISTKSKQENQEFITLFSRRRQKLIFLLAAGLLLFTQSHAQNWSQIRIKSDDALLAFYEYRFYESARIYEEILQEIPNSANFAYMAALAYFATTENIPRAIELLESAVKNIAPIGTYKYSSIKELRAPSDAYYFLGRCYLAAGQYEKAEQAFLSFIENTYKEDELIPLARQQIKSIPLLKNKIDISAKLEFENLKEINNDKPNLFPVVSGDKRTMAFTVPLEDGLNVFISRWDNNKWSSPRNITWDINGGVYRTAFLSYDGKILYLINDNPPQQIVYSENANGTWTPVKKMKKPINGSDAQSAVALTKDGRTMYFTSNRPGGLGGFDIYVSTLNDKGKWSNPVNMGNIVNTEFNEEFVALSPDEKYLFFSSEGHNTFGGTDIFVWEIGSSMPPINLGYPLNNALNNNYFFPLDKNIGLISLVAPDGFGDFDIYRVTITDKYPLLAQISYDPSLNISDNIVLEITNASQERVLLLDPLEMKPKHELGFFVPGVYKLAVFGKSIENTSITFEIIRQLGSEPTVVEFDIRALKQPEPEPIVVKEPEKPIIPPAVPTREETKITPASEQAPIVEVVAVNQQPQATKKTAEPKPTEKPKPAPPAPKTAVAKPVSPPTTSFERLPEQPQKGQYTIQIMALELPLTINELSKVGDVNIFYSTSGYYLYSVGFYETEEDAKQNLDKIKTQFPSAFVRKVPAGEYVIQLMALKNPKDLYEVGQTLDEISMVKGSDNFYRYFIGGFKTRKDAEAALINIQAMGFPQAWIRKLPNQ